MAKVYTHLYMGVLAPWPWSWSGSILEYFEITLKVANLTTVQLQASRTWGKSIVCVCYVRY